MIPAYSSQHLFARTVDKAVAVADMVAEDTAVVGTVAAGKAAVEDTVVAEDMAVVDKVAVADTDLEEAEDTAAVEVAEEVRHLVQEAVAEKVQAQNCRQLTVHRNPRP